MITFSFDRFSEDGMRFFLGGRWYDCPTPFEAPARGAVYCAVKPRTSFGDWRRSDD